MHINSRFSGYAPTFAGKKDAPSTDHSNTTSRSSTGLSTTSPPQPEGKGPSLLQSLQEAAQGFMKKAKIDIDTFENKLPITMQKKLKEANERGTDFPFEPNPLGGQYSGQSGPYD